MSRDAHISAYKDACKACDRELARIIFRMIVRRVERGEYAVLPSRRASMNSRDNYPPGVTGNEPEIAGYDTSAWDAWAASVQPLDRCACAGRPATVTSVTPERLWARLDGRGLAEPWEWEDVGPALPEDRWALSRRLMMLPPEARPGFVMPHTPPEHGMELEPAREHETGILWRWFGPVPATVRACSSEPWCWLPDLDDAATVGVVLAAARMVHDAPRLSAHWFAGDEDHPSPFSEPGWLVDGGNGENVICGATDYAEALVCALEEAVEAAGGEWAVRS